MSDWEEQLNNILGDPAQMERIADLAKSLMGGEQEAESSPPSAMPDLGQLAAKLLGGGEAPAQEAAMLGRLSRLFSSSGEQDDNKRALLTAMKPYLSERRREKMDRAMRLARMAKLAQLALGEGEGKNDV